MREYIGHRPVARPELDNTFWTASTYIEIDDATLMKQPHGCMLGLVHIDRTAALQRTFFVQETEKKKNPKGIQWTFVIITIKRLN